MNVSLRLNENGLSLNLARCLKELKRTFPISCTVFLWPRRVDQLSLHLSLGLLLHLWLERMKVEAPDLRRRDLGLGIAKWMKLKLDLGSLEGKIVAMYYHEQTQRRGRLEICEYHLR